MMKSMSDAALVSSAVGAPSSVIGAAAPSSAQDEALELDEQFLKTFSESTIETLQVQCNTPVIAGKPFLKGSQEMRKAEIAGVSPINDPQLDGTMAVTLSESFFVKLMEGMFRIPIPEITDEIEDGAAELLNMIHGLAKTTLNQKGFAIEKSRPTLVRGSAIRIRHPSRSKIWVIPFRCDEEEFYVEFGIMLKRPREGVVHSNQNHLR